MSVNNSFSVQLMGLLPSTLYNCCVSAVYESYAFTHKGACIETVKIEPGHSNSRTSADTIGGVLGFIIAVLLVLLAISGAALVYLIRQRFNMIPKVSSRPFDRNSTHVPVRRNLSYATTPPQSTTDGLQATQAGTLRITEGETDAVAEYSRIGPSYETIDSRRQHPAAILPERSRNRVPAGLSERYEFSEAHLAVVGDSGGVHGIEGEVGGVDHETPQNLRQIEEHEGYSHLQH